jgi:hypothetical protein
MSQLLSHNMSGRTKPVGAAVDKEHAADPVNAMPAMIPPDAIGPPGAPGRRSRRPGGIVPSINPFIKGLIARRPVV